MTASSVLVYLDRFGGLGKPVPTPRAGDPVARSLIMAGTPICGGNSTFRRSDWMESLHNIQTKVLYSDYQKLWQISG